MAKGGTIEYGVRFNVDQSSLTTIRTEINRIAHEIKEMAKDPETLVSKDTIANVEKLQHALNQSWNTKLNQLNLTKFQSELQKSKISMTQLKDTFLEIGKFGTFNNLTSNLLTANSQLKVTNDWMERIATSFGNVARYALSSKIFNNFVNSISKAYQYTVDLDTALNRIRIVSNQSAEQMDRFAVNANKAAKALGTSTLEYAKGALIYYQQGLSAEEANKRTEVTLKMANVLGTSAQEVSNYMTAIWNNFKDGTETLEHYADVITALGAATASSSEEIATGLEKFSAVAKTIGLSYEYATTALATVVAQTRQSADTVGTAFKTIFARMEDLKLGKTLDDGTTLGKYSSTLAKIGVDIKDQNGQLKDMDTILNEMGAKWATLSKDQQVAVAQGVAGIRQYTQLTALLDNWDKFTQNLTVAQGATGTLQKQQEIYMESFEAHLQKLKTEAERTYDILFDADSAKDFIDVVTAGFTKINDVLANMGGGLNTFINLLSQVGTIFSKQIGTEVVRVWNNAKTSFMGQKKKEAFVDETIKTYQEPNKTGLEKIYGKNDLTDKAVEQQAKNIKQILKVSSGLTSETQEQVVKEQQKIAILDVEIEKREKVLELAKKHNILTSEQAGEWKNKAAEHGYAGAVNQYGQMEKALKEKETGVDAQQRQEYADLNQNREDIVREGQQNQDIAKTTRKVFATVQAVNALTSAMKVLSDESATTKEKVSGVAQSAVSGIGAAVSAFNPLVGMLIQIGGSLLVPIITDMIDFRSEMEKLEDEAKVTQEHFEKVSNEFQELKGSLSNYESAKKGLEGLEQGTVEFYEAVIKANEEAQKLIKQLGLIAGLDYSIDGATGIIKFNTERLEAAMLEAQKKVFSAQVGSLTSQYILKATQQDNVVKSAAAATRRESTNYFSQISEKGMRDILSGAIKNKETIVGEDENSLYTKFETYFDYEQKIQNNWLKSINKNNDIISAVGEGAITVLNHIDGSANDITTIVADSTAEYKKLSAEMLALERQILEAGILAYGTESQRRIYQQSTNASKDILAGYLDTLNSAQYYKDREDLINHINGISYFKFNRDESEYNWAQNHGIKRDRVSDVSIVDQHVIPGIQNWQIAQQLGLSKEQSNQYLEWYKGHSGEVAVTSRLWTDTDSIKAMALLGQGNKYIDSGVWQNAEGEKISESDIFDTIDKDVAKAYLKTELGGQQLNKAVARFQERAFNDVADWIADNPEESKGLTEENKRYINEAFLALRTKNKEYDYSILNQDEANVVASLANDYNISGAETEKQRQQFDEARWGNQNIKERELKDLTEYNAAIEANATALGTSKEALELYDIALQNADKHQVKYTKTLADTAADSYKFNKAFNQGRKVFSDNKDAWNKYIKALKTHKNVSYDVADGAGEIVKSLKEMGITLTKDMMKNPEALKQVNQLLTGTEAQAEKAYDALRKMSVVENLTSKFGIAKTAAEEFYNTIINGNNQLGDDITDQVNSLLAGSQNVKMSLEDWKKWAEDYGINIEVKNKPTFDVNSFTPGETVKQTRHTISGRKIFDDEGKVVGTQPSYSYVETIEEAAPTLYGVGDFKYTSNGGGGKKNFSIGSNGGKSGGSKGGGSSSKPKHEKEIDEKTDRYHKVNTQIAKVEKQLQKVQTQQEKLVGGQLIENLNQQWILVNTQIKNYNEKLKIAIAEQNELSKKLAGQGVKFNKDGTVNNYEESIKAAQERYNQKVRYYNSLSKSKQDKLDAQYDDYGGYLAKYKDEYEEFKTDIERYDEIVVSVRPEIDQQILDSLNKQIEINIQKFNLKLKVTLDMNQATRDWNEWKKRIIDGVREDDILGNAKARLGDFSTYYADNGHGDIQTQTEQVNKILRELKIMDEGGLSSVYSATTTTATGETVTVNDRAKALEELKEKYSELMQSLSDAEEITRELHQAVLDQIDASQEAFDKQVENYNFLNDLIEHDKKVIELVYGEKSYKELDQFYKKQQENYNKTLDFQKKEKDFWKKQMDTDTQRVASLKTQLSTLKEGTTEWKNVYDQYKDAEEELESVTEKWKTSVQDFNKTLEESLQNAVDKFQNSINAIFEEMNDAVTGGLGLDYVKEEWDLINKNADRYLDTVNATYGIHSLEKKYTEAINKATNPNAQQKIKKLMDEQLDDLKQKDRLTQYDLDRANKLYDIELARITLEEAQMNKSQMRLRRDSQGNYTYQYVANEDKITEAQNKLTDLYNQLYNFDKNRYSSILNDAYSAWVDYQQKLAEAEMINDPEKQAERKMLIQQQYDELMTQIEMDYNDSKYNLQESLFSSLASLSAEQINQTEIAYGGALVNAEGNTEIAFDGISNSIKDAFEGADKISSETFNKIVGIAKEASNNITGFNIESFDAIKQGYDTLPVYEQEILAKSLIPTWENGVSQMVEYFSGKRDNSKGMAGIQSSFIDATNTMQELFVGKDGTSGFAGATRDGWNKITEAEKEYHNDITALEESSGTTFSTIKSGEDEVYQTAQSLVEENDTLIGKYDAELLKIQEVYQAVEDLRAKYVEAEEAAKNAATAAYNYEHNELENQINDIEDQEPDKTPVVPKEPEPEPEPPKPEPETPKVEPPKTGSGNGKLEVGDEVTFTTNKSARWAKNEGNGTGIYSKVFGNKFYVGTISGSLARIKDPHGPNYTAKGWTGWIDKKWLSGYDTGGYTGSWDNSGRLAMLHQKELVLNAKDTENMLNTVAIMRGLTYSLGSTMLSRLAGATATGYSGGGSDSDGILEQNVHIDATFPNVKNATEIEEALNNLVNAASQRAYERR